MFCPETRIFKELMTACGAVVAGEEENGEFIGEPRAEAKPSVALVNAEAKFAFPEPLMIPAIWGIMSR